MADRIVVMNHGRIEQVGTPREVYERAGHAVRRRLPRQGQRAAGRRRRRRPVPRRHGVARRRAAADIAAGTAVEALPAPRGIACTPNGAVARGQRARRARSRKVEFLGTFCLVGLALDAAGAPALVANVPQPGGRRRRARAGQRRHRQPAAGGAARARLSGRRWPRPPARCAGRRPRRRSRRSCTGRTGSRRRCCVACCVGARSCSCWRRWRRSWSERAGQVRRVRRPAALPRVLRDAGAAQSIWNTLWVALRRHRASRCRSRSPSPTRSRARACRGKWLFRIIALTPILAPSLLAAISFIQWFGNQGAAQVAARRRVRSTARSASCSLDLRDVSARADDPADRAAAGRRAPVRGGRVAGHADAGASSSRSRCPAPSTG